MGALYSNSHSINSPYLINRSIAGRIPAPSSILRGYCLILTGRNPCLSLTIIGEAFFAFLGVSVACTPGYTWFWTSSGTPEPMGIFMRAKSELQLAGHFPPRVLLSLWQILFLSLIIPINLILIEALAN